MLNKNGDLLIQKTDIIVSELESIIKDIKDGKLLVYSFRESVDTMCTGVENGVLNYKPTGIEHLSIDLIRYFDQSGKNLKV